MHPTSARRPIKTRATSWAQALARLLLKFRLTPNKISVASILFAAMAGSCIFLTRDPNHTAWLWLLAAVCIQLRLICNLLDGMLAVEGGLGTPDGDLYNETPDRLADIIIFVSAGYACAHSWGENIGWIAASGAILTAYIRMHGATLTHHHDFCGPMAKPQRMAVMTAVCLIMLIGTLVSPNGLWLPHFQLWSLAAIATGIWITFGRRLIRLSKNLRQPS